MLIKNYNILFMSQKSYELCSGKCLPEMRFYQITSIDNCFSSLIEDQKLEILNELLLLQYDDTFYGFIIHVHLNARM